MSNSKRVPLCVVLLCCGPCGTRADWIVDGSRQTYATAETFAGHAGASLVAGAHPAPTNVAVNYTGTMIGELQSVITEYYTMVTNSGSASTWIGNGIDTLNYSGPAAMTNGGITNLVITGIDATRYVSIFPEPTCTNIDLSLRLVSGACLLGTAAATGLKSIVLDSLESVGGTFPQQVVMCGTNFSTLSAPLLRSTGYLYFSGPGGASLLSTISLPSYKFCASSSGMFWANWPNLTTINLPNLVYSGGKTDAYTGNGKIANVTFGTVGVTKTILGNQTYSNQALTAASLTNILSVLASLDGTAGTTPWSYALTVSGGTSVGTNTWSAQLLAWRAQIIANGGIVTANP